MKVDPLGETVLLLSASFLIATSLMIVDSMHERREVLLFVEGLCCDYMVDRSSVALRTIDSVNHVSPSVSDGSIQLTMSDSGPVDVDTIWSKAERASLRPKQLLVDGRVVKMDLKPIREAKIQ